jgi:UPF0716 protein FxsA
VAIFLLLFVVLPLAEIYVAVQVSHAIGALNTVVLLALLSIGGLWLAKFAGFGVINRIRRQLQTGQMPTNELIDGGLILAAGILLLVPGFITGLAGLLLLFPPSRTLARGMVKRRFTGRITYVENTHVERTYVENTGDPGRLDGPNIIDI